MIRMRKHPPKWARKANRRRGSALWNMRNVKTPVLILHGENDVRVPLSQAIVFHWACVPPRVYTYTVEIFLVERTSKYHLVLKPLFPPSSISPDSERCDKTTLLEVTLFEDRFTV